MNNHNPLEAYYRAVKSYVTLPSGTSFYNSDVIEFVNGNELEIKPMTSKDEVMLKNPEALLNGEAMRHLIHSCVPGVKKADELLGIDVDVLVVAIRIASCGEILDIEAECPKCKHTNVYGVNLQEMLSTISKLHGSHAVPLESGLTVFVKPHTFKSQLLITESAYKQTRIINALQNNNNISDEERLREFSKSMNSMSEMNVELMIRSIEKFIDESEGLEIHNTEEYKAVVMSFLMNISKNDSDNIRKAIAEINSVGLDKKTATICEKCNHQWTNNIEINPINFFKDS